MILVHGTFGSYRGSGKLGIYGVGRIQRSAQQLARFVARVRERTGAARVSLVGHSQGEMMPRHSHGQPAR